MNTTGSGSIRFVTIDVHAIENILSVIICYLELAPGQNITCDKTDGVVFNRQNLLTHLLHSRLHCMTCMT